MEGFPCFGELDVGGIGILEFSTNIIDIFVEGAVL